MGLTTVEQDENLQKEVTSKTICNQSVGCLEQKAYHYIKCDFNHSWEAVRAFEDGVELFIDDKGNKPINGSKYFYCGWFDKLYTRKEIDPMKEVKKELQKFLTRTCYLTTDTSFDDFLEDIDETYDGIDFDKTFDKAFIDACCIVAKLKDKI
jgi:hypothetical protein